MISDLKESALHVVKNALTIRLGGITLRIEHTKKITATLALTLLLTAGLAGCGGSKEENAGVNTEEASNKQVTIKVSNWPKPNEEAKIAQYEQLMAKMKANYPDITVDKDEWGYDVSSFLPKAASGQLPTVYETFLQKLAKSLRQITRQISRIR